MLYFAIFILISLIFLIFIGVKKEKKKVDPSSENVYIFPVTQKKDEMLHYRLFLILGAWMIKKNAIKNDKKKKFVLDYCSNKFPLQSSNSEQDYFELFSRSIHVRSIARWVVNQLKEPKERIEVISFLIEICLIENALIDREIIALVRFGEWIGVGKAKIDHLMLHQYDKSKEFQSLNEVLNPIIRKKKAYQILELDFNATIDEIKKQYKRMVLMYHPDKNQYSNEQELQEFTQKFINIKDAYEELMQ